MTTWSRDSATGFVLCPSRRLPGQILTRARQCNNWIPLLSVKNVEACVSSRQRSPCRHQTTYPAPSASSPSSSGGRSAPFPLPSPRCHSPSPGLQHAKPCHGNSSIQGEGDFYVEDAVYDLVVARKNAHQNALPGPQPAPAHQVASHPVASGSHSHH